MVCYHYFSNECEARTFWQSTGSNDIIGEIIAETDKEIYTKLTSLTIYRYGVAFSGKSVAITVE